VLPDDSETALIKDGGHFLQLDQPDVVARHIVDFVGQAS
jgi:pimeloyl-ACP methyl ester carboxylesterase